MRGLLAQEPTEEMLKSWQALAAQYKNKLRVNRKSGAELLAYLQNKYVLTEIFDKNAADAVTNNVTMNAFFAEKLPDGATPLPKTFYLENAGNGHILFKDENKDPPDVWGGNITKIFVGVDVVTGFYMVEGSAMLWDELNALRGLDEKDLQNWACVAQYIISLKRFNLLSTALAE